MDERLQSVVLFNGLSDRRFELSKYLTVNENKQVFIAETENEKYDPEFSLHLDDSLQKKQSEEIERVYMQNCSIKLRRDYNGLDEAMNRLCLSCAASFFNQISLLPGEEYLIKELMLKLNVKDHFKHFFRRLLVILEESGYLVIKNEKVAVYRSITQIPATDAALSDFVKKHEQFASYANLLVHCASYYDKVFQGIIPANEVLYPGGEFNMVDEVDKNLPVISKRQMYGDVLSAIVSSLLHNQNKKVRILEIGAGTGELTSKIVPQLKSINNIEYWFTDIGQSFVAKAKFDADNKDYNFMKFAKLDISKDIYAQGFFENSFDIVLSYDVLQATDDIGGSLQQISKLLVPGGILAQIQTYGDHHIDNLIYGLSPGWWNFAEDPLRGQRITLLPNEWNQILQQSNFIDVQTLPQDVHTSDAVILISRNNKDLPRHESHVFYSTAKNNRYKAINSYNNHITINFIKSFERKDVEEYLKTVPQEAEILFKDDPEDQKSYDGDAELSPSDAKLFEILEAILGVEKVKLTDNLTEIGLDSLSGLLLISRIKEEFKTALTMKHFYDFQFVSDISEYLRNSDLKKSDTTIEETEQIAMKDMDDLFSLL